MISGTVYSEWILQGIGNTPDSKVHGANMGPIWDRQDPAGPHVGPMNVAIWDTFHVATPSCLNESYKDTVYRKRYQSISAIISEVASNEVVASKEQNCISNTPLYNFNWNDKSILWNYTFRWPYSLVTIADVIKPVVLSPM